MAIQPLYIEKSLLLQRLRMSETVDTDTLTLIDQTIADVRLEFYRRLTLDRALEIVAFTSVENPTTTDSILRSIAEVTEFYWVVSKLICILPTMFIETANAIQNSFKDVPITRDGESLQKFIRCIEDRVESNLGLLIVPENLGTGPIKVFSTGRPVPYILTNNFIGLPIKL